MRQILFLLILFTLTACQQETSTETTEPGTDARDATAEVAESAEVVVEPAFSLADSLAGRSEADRARDAGRKPAAVIEFLGIEPGMTVLDLFAASGWYTEVLSHAVGADGTVYAQNPGFMLTMRDGANDKAMAARLAASTLGNIQRVDREATDLGLAAESLDAALMALNFHDVYNSAGAEAAGGLLNAVYDALKPGGVLGLIDHVGIAENDNAALHRIEKSKVLEVVQLTSFSVESESTLLSNLADDHSSGVFGPDIRGQTDRFLLRLKK